MFEKIKQKVKHRSYSHRLQDKLETVLHNLERPRSVIFYTTHKCASTFAQRLFEVMARNANYELVDYAGAIWGAGDRLSKIETPYEIFLERAYSELYSLNGKIYAPQREYLDFPGRHKFRHIFFLRDPRDVLVSAYYSFAFTHAEPSRSLDRDDFLAQRSKMQQQGIDDYVLEQAEQWILPFYRNYQKLRDTADDYLYVKYSLFINDTAKFIQQIADYCDLNPSTSDINFLVQEASPVQTTEKKKSHKRSGKTGQYLEKLRPETVDKLNEILADVLRDWEFETEKES